MLSSPYAGHPLSAWPQITQLLIQQFPIQMQDLVSIVQDAWSDIYSSSFGAGRLVIGRDIFLPAQATGVILEKLIAVYIAERFPLWRGGDRKSEKDIVCCEDDRYSFEIKTSSSLSGLYGNRSTGHRAVGRTKFRTGYYLVVNYKLPNEYDHTNLVRQIRFGWIDDEDWIGQNQPTGQQASIGAALASMKLIRIL